MKKTRRKKEKEIKTENGFKKLPKWKIQQWRKKVVFSFSKNEKEKTNGMKKRKFFSEKQDQKKGEKN